MHKKTSAALLTLLLIFSYITADTDKVYSNTNPYQDTSFTGNLLKITREDDFSMGQYTGLLINNTIGNGALVLDENTLTGEFYSCIYNVSAFRSLIMSWNTSLPEGASVEVSARVYAKKPHESTGKWTSWLSWGVFGTTVHRSSISGTDTVDNLAYMDIDTLYLNNDYIGNAVQFRAVLKRASLTNEIPVIRQISCTLGNAPYGSDLTPTYAESPYSGAIPQKSIIAAPAFTQSTRDPDISGEICSPSTISIMLNSRQPSLNLLPEELALNLLDFGDSFGNWSFCTAGAGLYGYEAYVQYADVGILLQELAKGNTVGISVEYSNNKNYNSYLDGTCGTTDGHLITLIGYYFEDEHYGDNNYLHFYCSDTFSHNDPQAYRDYKWTQLNNCWSNRVAYIIPSQKPENGADITGVKRINACLSAAEGKSNSYALYAQDEKVDLKGFTTGKTSSDGHGVLAYTVSGFGCNLSKELSAGGGCIAYPKPLQSAANNTFFYTGISTDDMGNIIFDANNVLSRLGVKTGESRTVIIYAISNNGKMYIAKQDFARSQ